MALLSAALRLGKQVFIDATAGFAFFAENVDATRLGLDGGGAGGLEDAMISCLSDKLRP